MPVWLYRVTEEWLASSLPTVKRDFDLPIAFKGFNLVKRDFDLPVAFKGAGLVNTDFDLPVAWSSNFSVRGVRTPLSLTASSFNQRAVRTPISLLGAQGILLIQWNDFAELAAALPLFWNDVNAGLNAQLPINWDVRDSITPLLVTWRVIPNVQPLFSADVQKPTATVTETP